MDPLTDRLYTKSEYAPEVPAKDEKDKDDEEEEEEEEEEPEEEMIEEEEEVSYHDDCRGIVMCRDVAKKNLNRLINKPRQLFWSVGISASLICH